MSATSHVPFALFGIFEHENEESNDQKKCLTDCPKDYPYYTIRIDEHDISKKYYECQGKCEGYYIENLDLKINSKLCLNSCPDSTNPDYKYQIIDGQNFLNCVKIPLGMLLQLLVQS